MFAAFAGFAGFFWDWLGFDKAFVGVWWCSLVLAGVCLVFLGFPTLLGFSGLSIWHLGGS